MYKSAEEPQEKYGSAQNLDSGDLAITKEAVQIEGLFASGWSEVESKLRHSNPLFSGE